MIEKIKTRKDSFYWAAGVYLLLSGYCLVAGLSLLIPLLLVVFGIHLALFRRADQQRILQLGLLLAVIAAVAHGMTSYSRFTPLYVPVAAVPMLVMLLYNDLQLAFSMSFISSALVVLMVGTGLEHLISIFVGGLMGAYAVRDARTRGALLLAGLLAGGAQAFACFLAMPSLQWVGSGTVLWPLFTNGLVAAGAATVTLRVFEVLFGELTNFTLLELSDSLNQPLLKRLAFEAPGTYHHSLIMSNLAGAAADVIGANALLTRVGAYYHDIGKIERPDYFVENQLMSDNRHESLEPSMSRLVILNHVKLGSELARQHKLSPRIIDFIEQHHGTSLIHFFYQRALEAGDSDSVKEEDYRYPGPKPQTREVAIVMLADAVEGATRALDEHTPTKIDEVARKVVNNKFIDGQLDECNLTLRECDLICRSFTRTLSAMYHVRVKYPGVRKNAQ